MVSVVNAFGSGEVVDVSEYAIRGLFAGLSSVRAEVGMNELWTSGRTAGLSFARAESVLGVDCRAPELEPESERVLSYKVCWSK